MSILRLFSRHICSLLYAGSMYRFVEFHTFLAYFIAIPVFRPMTRFCRRILIILPGRLSHLPDYLLRKYVIQTVPLKRGLFQIFFLSMPFTRSSSSLSSADIRRHP